ncbi:MAG TPA: bifunctional aldolase/short-chain dehydrogenase [Byssovorax sp.]|jgi:rhamnose utilization protein RhaD (predicted bifunctional aldolase and dehydrogenase)/NAD(P)-dependent dehydrogenase (short-subunit alcohol dehydrogenase family)
MDSLFDDAEAAEHLDRYAPRHGEDLALRVYTSRLLGADPSLVLHGGGNTSVKSRVTELLGDATDVLYVKGSGSDLATIEPHDFPACRLAHLQRCCERAHMTDEEMVAQLRGQMIDPSSPTPSVEALLHAILPAKFVDHTHADAVLSIVDQLDSEPLVREIWGDDALFVPYVMPGFALARRVAELLRAAAVAGAPRRLMILDKHGIFTWGDTARASYEAMIGAVDAAENRLVEVTIASSRRTVSAPAPPDIYEGIAPALRGALGRRSGASWIVTGRSSPQLVSFADHEDIDRVSQVGCATPDHVIRTKPTPLVLRVAEIDAKDPAALREKFEAEIAAYEERYTAYFKRCVAARGVERTQLDPYPRVFLVPGLGAFSAAKTRAAAEIAADIYEHTTAVIDAANGLGAYRPVSELDLFDLEYWSLEQAKLKKGAVAAGPLAGKVALVTGAGGGIGLATAEAMARAGAHVLLTDKDQDALAEAWADLERAFPRRIWQATCDVSSFTDAKRAVSIAVGRFGGLDVVVSNAGGAWTGSLHTPAGDAALRSSLEVNLLGHQNVARAAAAVLVAQGTGGALLFNASKSAFNQGPDFGPYAIPKAALVALMKQYAIDLAPAGVRANAINADRVRTDLFKGGMLEARAKARGVAIDEYFKGNLLHRETTVADVADGFVFLATAEATTGCVVTVDGGNAAAFPR